MTKAINVVFIFLYLPGEFHMHYKVLTKNVFFKNVLLASTLLILAPNTLLYATETRYVSDFLIVNIKDSFESPYNVVGTVQSDQKLEVLEKSGKYIKVRTENNKEGWISNQYLKSSIPKKVTIAKQKLEIEQLLEKIKLYESQGSTLPIASTKDKDEIKLLKFKLAELSKVHQSLQNDYQSILDNPPNDDELLSKTVKELREKLLLLEKENKKLQLTHQEQPLQQSLNLADNELQKLKLQHTNLLQSSENIGSITEERDALLVNAEATEQFIQTLQAENKDLLNKQRIYWFIAGAIVFTFGLLFGKVGSKKKNRFSY